MTGRGPTCQKIADKAQGVALPAASGTLVLCFAARRGVAESLSSEALRAHPSPFQKYDFE